MSDLYNNKIYTEGVWFHECTFLKGIIIHEPQFENPVDYLERDFEKEEEFICVEEMII